MHPMMKFNKENRHDIKFSVTDVTAFNRTL